MTEASSWYYWLNEDGPFEQAREALEEQANPLALWLFKSWLTGESPRTGCLRALLQLGYYIRDKEQEPVGRLVAEAHKPEPVLDQNGYVMLRNGRPVTELSTVRLYQCSGT